MPKAVFAIGRDRQPLPVPRSMVDRSTLVNIPKSTRSVIAKAEAAEVGGRYADAYASYFEVGELMLDTADYARAKKNLLKALDMAKKMKSLRHQTEANLHLSEAFRGMQKYVPALKHAQAARELAQRSRDFRKIAESWLKEGVVLLNHAEALQEDEGSASYYKSAITAFKEVLSLISSFEANVRDLYELDAEINIGICQKGLENFDEAETAFLRCIIMAKRLGKNEHVRLSQVSENMGILYLEHGKPLDALKNFQVAFDNVGLNDTESQASLKMNIAYCQRNLNKIDEALKSAKESREIAERSHLEESIELAQRFITEIETILTQDRELKRMEEELLRPGGAVNAHQALENRIRAAEMNMKADRPDKAVGHLKVAAGMIRKSKSPPPEEVHNWARVQAFLAECLLANKKYSEARQLAATLLNIPKSDQWQLPSVQYRARAQLVYAKALLGCVEKLGDRSVTHTTLQGAFDDVEKLSLKLEDDAMLLEAYEGLASTHKRFGFSRQAKEARKLATELQQKLDYVEKIALDADEGELSGPDEGADSDNEIGVNNEEREAEVGDAMVISDEEPEKETSGRRRLVRAHRRGSESDDARGGEQLPATLSAVSSAVHVSSSRIRPDSEGLHGRQSEAQATSLAASVATEASFRTVDPPDPYAFDSSLDDDIANLEIEYLVASTKPVPDHEAFEVQTFGTTADIAEGGAPTPRTVKIVVVRGELSERPGFDLTFSDGERSVAWLMERIEGKFLEDRGVHINVCKLLDSETTATLSRRERLCDVIEEDTQELLAITSSTASGR